MGRKDKGDGQMEAYCTTTTRVKKYYFKLFMHILDIVCSTPINCIKRLEETLTDCTS